MLRSLLTIVLLASFGLASAPVAAQRRASPDVLPDVAVLRLDGSTSSMVQWRGRPLVLNVWATWCPPCRKEMPSLQKLSDELAPEGIGVVALSIDDDINLVREFVLKYGIRFPVAIAASPANASSELGVQALPLTLYVTADGRIVSRVLGERDWSEEKLVKEIRARLAPPGAKRVAQ